MFTVVATIAHCLNYVRVYVLCLKRHAQCSLGSDLQWQNVHISFVKIGQLVEKLQYGAHTHTLTHTHTTHTHHTYTHTHHTHTTHSHTTHTHTHHTPLTTRTHTPHIH